MDLTSSFQYSHACAVSSLVHFFLRMEQLCTPFWVSLITLSLSYASLGGLLYFDVIYSFTASQICVRLRENLKIRTPFITLLTATLLEISDTRS